MTSTHLRPLRVAVVGAGPAGIYAADILTKGDPEVSVDIFDRLPTPYGLIRYGVAPDHPRIKAIIVALHRVLSNARISFLGNVQVGSDITVAELRQFYDAVVFATGAERDRPLNIPGADLESSYGAADFVAFYDAHPDREPSWDLSEARSVAVIGVGNVALDVARILARSGDELLATDIPAHVHAVLRNSAVTDVHMFARRGPAQAKFTPVELRELDHSPNLQVLVQPEGMEFDAGSQTALAESKSLRMVVDVLSAWAIRDPDPHISRRIHIHFLEDPVEIMGADGRVIGLRTERQSLAGDGSTVGTGEFTTWDIQAVYRAIGYRSTAIEHVPFDSEVAVIPNVGGRVVDAAGTALPGLYATGWIKRGPIGLIGHTKSDAAETVANLLSDAPALLADSNPVASSILSLLHERGSQVTDFDGWNRLDIHELTRGQAEGRERLKVHTRSAMTDIARREGSMRTAELIK